MPFIVRNKSVEDEKHFVMECFSLSAHRNTFFDELAQIVPSFFSKTVTSMTLLVYA